VPEAAGPWACVPTTDKEMTPIAAPAMATVIIEPENISRMMVSFSVSGFPIKRQTGGDCSIFGDRPTAAFPGPSPVRPARLQDAITAATKAGQIAVLAADAGTAQSSWWVTTSPFITKDDFER
jgi:hypothetical protein